MPELSMHYLIMIGVRPSEQGKGAGGQLVQHIVKQAQADHHAHGIALDTENKSNLEYYKRFGFQLYCESQLDRIKIYSMMKKLEL